MTSTFEVTCFVIGSIACLLTVICTIPQLVTIIRKRSSKDVSIASFITLLLAQLTWIVYGALKIDIAILVTNGLASIVTLCIIISAGYFQAHESTCHTPNATHTQMEHAS